MDDQALTQLHHDHKKVLRIAAAIFAIPPLIAAGVVEIAGLVPHGLVLGPVLLAAGWWVIGMPGLRYRTKGFAISDDRLRVVRGALFRSDTVVPFSRVQHLDVDQGPLERAYGLATLVLHTAGNHNASVNLPGLAHADAVAMREAIRAHIKRETL